MFRSRLLIDRQFTRGRQTTRDENSRKTSKDHSFKRKAQFRDSNNRTVLSNNFDFIEPCEIEGEIDSLGSQRIKNWKYHLTNNKF